MKPFPGLGNNDSHLLCDHAKAPFADCYCRAVTGRTVPNIALYCMGSFRDCPVYRKWRLDTDMPETIESPTPKKG